MKKEENSKDERRRDDEITPEGVPRLEQTARCCKIKKLINFPRILLRGLVHSGRYRYANRATNLQNISKRNAKMLDLGRKSTFLRSDSAK